MQEGMEYIVKALKGNNCQLRLVFPSKLPFTIEKDIRNLPK
jgi:hypothetical protein